MKKMSPLLTQPAATDTSSCNLPETATPYFWGALTRSKSVAQIMREVIHFLCQTLTLTLILRKVEASDALLGDCKSEVHTRGLEYESSLFLFSKEVFQFFLSVSHRHRQAMMAWPPRSVSRSVSRAGTLCFSESAPRSERASL